MKISKTEMAVQETKKATPRSMAISVFLNSCALFTVLTLLLLATQLTSSTTFVAPLRIFMIYPFSLCLSLAGLALKAKGLKTFLKVIIHFTVSVAAFYFFICPSNSKTPIILFCAFYIIIAAVILTVLKLKKKKTEPKPEYVSMFSKASKPKK